LDDGSLLYVANHRPVGAALQVRLLATHTSLLSVISKPCSACFQGAVTALATYASEASKRAEAAASSATAAAAASAATAERREHSLRDRIRELEAAADDAIADHEVMESIERYLRHLSNRQLQVALVAAKAAAAAEAAKAAEATLEERAKLVRDWVRSVASL
jgi:hypothetical protein